MFPRLDGTALPGSTVLVRRADTGALLATATADASGAWRIPAVTGLPDGSSTLEIVQRADSSESLPAVVTVSVAAPTLFVGGSATAGQPMTVLLLGARGRVQLLLDGTVIDERDVAVFGATVPVTIAHPGAHMLSARYVDDAGRVGPASTRTIAVR